MRAHRRWLAQPLGRLICKPAQDLLVLLALLELGLACDGRCDTLEARPRIECNMGIVAHTRQSDEKEPNAALIVSVMLAASVDLLAAVREVRVGHVRRSACTVGRRAGLKMSDSAGLSRYSSDAWAAV